MPRSRYFVLLPISVLLVFGWLLLALSWPNPFVDERIVHLLIGALLGTLFGRTTVVAAWTALGPGPVLLRIPLGLLWIATDIVTVTLRLRADVYPPDAGFTLVLGACLFSQWLGVQVPLWILAIAYRLRLRRPNESFAGGLQEDRQFGIRQLIIATTIVAAMLGIGRLVVQNTSGPSTDREWVILAFLGVAAVVASLPLVLAALLPRFALPAVLGVLMLIALATLWELPLLQQFPGGSGPELMDLVWINVFTSAWILAFAVAIRWSGYSLTPAVTA
jgi:hypothetical protein